MNPDCKPALRLYFEFEGDYPRCPKCTSTGYPVVQKRVLVHLIYPDPKGPIPGKFRRYKMACDHTREHLATPSNGEACTDNVGIVNCPGCLKDWGDRTARELGDPITAQQSTQLGA